MQWSDIQFRPSARTLRQFAGLWLAFFGGLAAWQIFFRHEERLAEIFALLALAVGLPGLAWPRLIRPVYVGWMVLAFPIGWTVSQVMLALLYYGLFTPIGLLFRLVGRDPLHLRRPATATYWSAKAIPEDPRCYFKQF
jgi:hypothetical protein